MNLKMTEAQKTLYYIAENMKMEKKISDEGYQHFQMAIKALGQQPTTQEILSHIETGITATGQSDSYCVGFCNALVWLKSCITHEEPQYFEDGKKGVGVNDN